MQRRGTHVEILLFAAVMQQPERQNIGQQAANSNPQHQAAGHRLRVGKAAHRLPDDQCGNAQQRNGVNKCGQRGQTQQAKGVACIGFTARELHRQQGHQQRGGIGQHMPGVRQQRQ